MAVTYTPISSQTLSSTTSSVTFSSISSTYTDLRLIISVNNNQSTAVSDMQITLNSDTSASYSDTDLAGNGSTASSGRHSGSGPYYVTYGFTIPGQNGMSNFLFDFMNYSNTTTYKTFLLRANNALGYTKADVFLWRNTAAISTIKFDAVTYSFAAGSTFTLYGIKAA